MKAFTRTAYGPPEVLQVKELPLPIPKKDELLIKIHATTISRTDCGVLWGMPFAIRFFTGLRKPTQPIPGCDFAGEVVQTGDAVTEFKSGDRVWGFYDQGLQSHATHMTIKAYGPVTKIPEGIDYKTAVASGEGAHYAINFINKVKVLPHAKAMVYGATGGIGSAMVQLLARHHKVEVIAVANTAHISKMAALGASRSINYETTNYWETEPADYDFMFDAVGKSQFSFAKKILKPSGIYSSSELGPGAENLYLPIITRFTKGPRVVFPLPVNCRKSVLLMTDLLAKGLFKPLIEKTYAPEQIAEAYHYVKAGKKTGNVIIDFSQWH